MTRSELQKLAKMRLDDGSILLRARRYAACYYVLGYAVECALKARIARQFRANTIPDWRTVKDVYTHDLQALVGLADLKDRQEEEFRRDPSLRENWHVVKDWSTDLRYATKVEGRKVREFASAIADPMHGVFQWLQRHW